MATTGRALIYAANQNKFLANVFTTFSNAVPEVLVQVDTARAELLGVTPDNIYTTLQAHLGSQFVNYFNLQSQVFQVIVQDAQQFRDKVSDIDQLYVRSNSGAEVPLNSLVQVSTVQGSNAVTRYNLYPRSRSTAPPAGAPAPGRPGGDGRGGGSALPQGYGYDGAASRTSSSKRRAGRVGFRLRAGVRLPVPGRAYKAGAAAVGDPVGLGRRPWRAAGAMGRGLALDVTGRSGWCC